MFAIETLYWRPIMRIEDLRKEALLYGMIDGYEELVDRLLDADVKLPEVAGDFYITINGTPLCILERAFVGSIDSSTVCSCGSLHESIAYRLRLKSEFPGAIVAVLAAACPEACNSAKAA
jgi:hypothetical protein